MNGGKVALVTGSSRGIGRATATLLAENGWAVAVNCLHSGDKARELVAQLQSDGYTAIACDGDVADYTAVERMNEEIRCQLGAVSLLVNNAGIAEQKLFMDLTPGDWHRMMAVHADGTFNTCRVFLPEMLRRHSGVIVNVSSMWGQVGGSCEVAYSAAKAAVIGLTRALAKEVGPSGVRVNCVAPGVIDTDMMKSFTKEVREELAQETPLCRLGKPEDVAQAIAFLASDAASFITGQVLAPNGGLII